MSWKQIAIRLARFVMQLSAADDVNEEAEKFVEEHLPEVYKDYQ